MREIGWGCDVGFGNGDINLNIESIKQSFYPEFFVGTAKGVVMSTVLAVAAQVPYLGPVLVAGGTVATAVMMSKMASDFENNHFYLTDDYASIMNNTAIYKEKREQITEDAFARNEAFKTRQDGKNIVTKIKENPEETGMFIGSMFGLGVANTVNKNIVKLFDTKRSRETNSIKTIDWSHIGRKGDNAAEHIRKNYGKIKLTKDNQGVFYTNEIKITEKSWFIAQQKNIKPFTLGNRDIYVIPHQSSGYAGGAGGQLQNFNNVTIITHAGKNKIVTAYPSGTTPPLPKNYKFILGESYDSKPPKFQ